MQAFFLSLSVVARHGQRKSGDMYPLGVFAGQKEPDSRFATYSTVLHLNPMTYTMGKSNPIIFIDVITEKQPSSKICFHSLVCHPGMHPPAVDKREIFAARYKPPPEVCWHSFLSSLFVGVPLMLPTVEERLHFIVFGLFGYMSVPNWGAFKAVYICKLTGMLDEILQWMLPDRVGDWRDVWFNWIACFGGIILGHFLGKNHETVHHSAGNADVE